MLKPERSGSSSRRKLGLVLGGTLLAFASALFMLRPEIWTLLMHAKTDIGISIGGFEFALHGRWVPLELSNGAWTLGTARVSPGFPWKQVLVVLGVFGYSDDLGYLGELPADGTTRSLSEPIEVAGIKFYRFYGISLAEAKGVVLSGSESERAHVILVLPKKSLMLDFQCKKDGDSESLLLSTLQTSLPELERADSNQHTHQDD